jgi:hypothetical protein
VLVPCVAAENYLVAPVSFGSPLIHLAFSVPLMANLVYMAPQTSGIGFALVLTRIPVYLLWRRSAAARAGARLGGQRLATPENP